MKWYDIKIDQEVYKYLKERAEPFEDTPNTILRRELFGDDTKNDSGNSDKTVNFPDFSRSIPTALQHTLEVIYLVKKHNISRSKATKLTANKYGIAPQTVLDKYCRQLDKKASEIDMLLEGKNLNRFRSILCNKYTDHRSTINKFFINYI